MARQYDDEFYHFLTASSPLGITNDDDENEKILEHDDELLFEKRLDTKSGAFIYQLKSTDFVTRDVPYGLNIQLTTAPQSLFNNNDFLAASSQNSPPWNKDIRRDIINNIRYKHIKKKEKENRISTLKEKERQTKIWKDSCERGSKGGNGHVILSGENLGYIWDDLRDFEAIYSTPLVRLSLIGHGLETCDNVGEKIKGLTLLNLSSNKIYSMDDSIGNLTTLLELNLSHNNLEHLPDSMGRLQQLQELNLSHNLLSELSSSFTQLCNVRRFTLEHNRIRLLPFFIGNMKACCELNMNSNCLMLLPTSISELSLLEKLLLNDNQLQSLPTELCLLKSIKIIHASRNLLVSIPDNIGNLSTLESLWLDFNRLSSIPYGFHGLVNLYDLKMEGNVDMVHPPMDVVQNGADSVKQWSETRLSLSIKVRQRQIITSLQDILDQIGTFGLKNEMGESVDISSIYQKDVVFNGETYFQFVEASLFETFLRIIIVTWAQVPENENDDRIRGTSRSFPYEREETERALREYEDLTGKVFFQQPKCRFQRCCCVDSDGKKKVCVPPAFGWMCERPAVMLKADLVTERNQEVKRRMKVEADKVNAKMQLAEKMAQMYLSSGEGRITFRKAAYRELLRRISNKDSTKDDHTGEKELVLSRRRQLNEIEEKLKSDFILQKIDCARDEAHADNQRIRKIIDLWKGASVDTFFIAWLKVTRKKRRQNMRMNSKGIEDKSISTTTNIPIDTRLSTSSTVDSDPLSTMDSDQLSLLDALEVIDVRQERILAASRILQVKRS